MIPRARITGFGTRRASRGQEKAQDWGEVQLGEEVVQTDLVQREAPDVLGCLRAWRETVGTPERS